MTTPTIHLFLNPTAGRGRAGRRQAQIIKLLAASNTDLELHESRAVGDLEDSVQEAVAAGAERLVVAGGDGSIHEAVNGLLAKESTAALGIIPTGTGNDTAKACGIPLNWEHATQLLADRLAANAPSRMIDVGRCNERYFVNGVGIGFDAQVTAIARSMRLPIGDLIYLFAVLRAMVGKLAATQVRISADRVLYDARLLLANVSNGPFIGGMFHIAPMAKNDDGKLELLIAQPVTRRRVFGLLPLLIKGEHLGEKEILHRSVTSLTIDASAPMLSHLDGEVQAPQTHFDIALKAASLRVL